MYTHEYLKSLATATSFGRGEDYFRQGRVGKITREDQVFTAKVRGSHSYKARLTLRPGGLKLKCDCRYEDAGICKHRVALGLAVLAQFGPPLPAAAGPDTSPEALGNALRDTSADVQLAFLARLLREREDLRQEFLQHVAPPPAAGAEPAPTLPPAAGATIESISTEVYEALADLAFDDDLLSEYADNYDEYLEDEGGGMLELANEILAEVLEPHAETVAADLRARRLSSALQRWVGVYEGITAATDPQADEYDLFSYEGYAGHVLTHWSSLLAAKGVEALLETQPFAPAETAAALALLLGRYPRQSSKAQEAQEEFPEHFYELLGHLAHDPATATQLRQLLPPAETLSPGAGQLLLQIAQVLADDALWLRVAEATAGQDVTVTTQLLDYYRQHADRANLLRVLRQGQLHYSRQLNPYILLHITPAEDQALYLMALEQRCRATHSLPDYRELQSYWSTTQRNLFVEEYLKPAASTRGSSLFAAELLVAENRPAELLPLLLSQQWAWQSTIPDLLALAARTHPAECFDAAMERTETLLQDNVSGRGRDVYQRIVSWLAALHAFPALERPVELFAAHLYADYSRLNALREELRAAKLVRVTKSGNQYQLAPSRPEDDELRESLIARWQLTKAGKK